MGVVHHEALGRCRQGSVREYWATPSHCGFKLILGKIGSVPTPWPSWLIVANPERADAKEVRDVLERLTRFIREFDSEEKREKDDVEFIKEKFGYPEEDVKVGANTRDLCYQADLLPSSKAWLKTVKYPPSCLEIPQEVITNTLR